jgi:uncharacterized protein (TIGR02246 family)
MIPDEQAIRTLVSLWHTATAAGDVDTVLTLMAEDVVFLVPGHPPIRVSQHVRARPSRPARATPDRFDE